MSFLSSRLCPLGLPSLAKIFIEPSYIPIRNYAARKGTRERKAKKIVKKEVVERVKFIPHNQRKKDRLLATRPKLKIDDSWKRDPIDDVYHVKYFKWTVYSFLEALQCHRETHHPDIYNVPNANLHLRIELNMVGEKPTRLVDDFTRIVPISHKFDHGEERPIIAFSKDDAAQKEAVEAGAQLVGGVDLIKQIQNGDILMNDFKYVVAHPDILPELVSLRGLMKRRFPSPRLGTLDVDLGALVRRFLNGISYSAKKDEIEKDFGLIQTVIGTLDMEGEHLESNFEAVVKDVNSMRPKREGDFITRCLLLSPPSKERLKVDHTVCIEMDQRSKKKKAEEEDDEEEVGEKVAL